MALIPSFDLYKSLESSYPIHYERLERSYSAYNASHAHRHNYFELLMFERSGGSHEIDFIEYSIQKQSVHLVSPGQVHILRRSKDVTGTVLSFTSDLFLVLGMKTDFLDNFSFFEPLQGHPIFLLDLESWIETQEVVQQIAIEFEGKREDRLAMMALLCSRLLLQLKRAYGLREQAGELKSLISRYKQLVKAHYLRHLSVGDYADMLSVTSGHLNDSVKKETGKTAKEWIQEQLILEAKRLLYHSPHSVKEIAAALGFDDPSYFNRFFRSLVGQTPATFREIIREKYH